MAIQYHMRAYHTSLLAYVDWVVNDTPDTLGTYSGYSTSDLTNIAVKRVVQSKVDNWLQPDQGFINSDGSFFHLNSFDWIHASPPTPTVIPPPTTYVGIAVARGGTTNAQGELPPGASRNYFSTLLWDEAAGRWKFIRNTNGDHTTLGAYQAVNMGDLTISGYVSTDGYVSIGNAPAQSGALRLTNTQWIESRKVAGSADGYLIRLDSVDRIQIGTASESPVVYMPGNLRVDGYMRDGAASPSLTGFVRNGNHTTIVTFRNTADNANISALSSAAVDGYNNSVVVGDTANSSVTLNTATGAGSGANATWGVSKFQVNGTTVAEIGTGNPSTNPFVRFASTASNPSFTQTFTAAGNGQILNVQAQTTTAAGLGGSLVLAAGAGGSNNGSVDINTGIVPANTGPTVLNDLKMRFYPTVAATASDNGSILLGSKYFRFHNTLSTTSPTTTIIGMRQDDISTNGATGQPLTIQSQNSTGTGTTTGGRLVLTSGTGGTAHGTVDIQTGGVNKIRVFPTTASSAADNNSILFFENLLRFDTAQINPLVRQDDTTTASATGQTFTLQAQNATGATSTGGALFLTSGTGTTNPGIVDIRTGGTSRIQLSTVTGTFSLNNFFINAAQTAPIWKQNDKTTNGATGETFTIQAQNETGTTSTGGKMVITSGTGTTVAGNVEIQTGGVAKITVTPTTTTIATNLVVNGTTTTVNSTVVDIADRVVHFNYSTGTVPVPSQITGFSINRGSLDGITPRDHHGLFWNEPDGLWKFAVNTVGNDTALTTTLPVLMQYLQLKPNTASGVVASAGDIRALNGTTIVAARNNADNNNLNIASTSSGDIVSYGDAVNAGVVIGTATAGAINLQVNSVTTASVVNNKFAFNKGRRRNITTITTTYQVLVTDDYIAVTTLAAPFTITLPASPTVGDTYEIKDATGNAATNNLTINGNGANIDGAANFLMSQPYASATFTFLNGQWSVS